METKQYSSVLEMVQDLSSPEFAAEFEQTLKDNELPKLRLLVGCLAGAIADNHKEIERLQAIADAADAFLAEPPEGMADLMPFSQYTTAGDCRALCKAFGAKASLKRTHA